MSVETNLRSRIVHLLRERKFFVQAIESETTPGLPDVYYRRGILVGWLELKHVKEMPKRPTTSIFASLNHPLLTEQKNWIDLELRHGGMADILVGFERDYFLVPGEFANIFNTLTEKELRVHRLLKQEIVGQLTKLRETR